MPDENKKTHRWVQRGLMATLSARDNSDVLGSNTGTPKDDEQPVQDVDDL